MKKGSGKDDDNVAFDSCKSKSMVIMREGELDLTSTDVVMTTRIKITKKGILPLTKALVQNEDIWNINT
jgi:hypothetical protein